MTTDQQETKCNFCKSQVIGAYCSTCGRPLEVPRINGRYLISEVGRILNLEKGILFTIRELLIRPGQNIQQFIIADRNRLVKPIVFIIICSLVYTLVQQFFHFEDRYVNYSFEESSASTALFQWVSANYGYANILMAIFIATWLRIFFWKSGYNFFEILILLCFMMGMGMLIFSIIGVAESLTGFKVLDVGFLFGIFYISWGIGQFFGKSKFMNYVKAFLCYIFGMFTFSIFILFLGALIDLFTA